MNGSGRKKRTFAAKYMQCTSNLIIKVFSFNKTREDFTSDFDYNLYLENREEMSNNINS
jgi:hypothetical protein